MKFQTLFVAAVAAGSLLVVAPSAAFAGTPPPPMVPEPTALAMWAGMAATGGVIYWWRNHRQR
jgi:hypothetical protein